MLNRDNVYIHLYPPYMVDKQRKEKQTEKFVQHENLTTFVYWCVNKVM